MIMADEEQNARNTCEEILRAVNLPGMALTVRYKKEKKLMLTIRGIFKGSLDNFSWTPHETKLLQWGMDIAEQAEI